VVTGGDVGKDADRRRLPDVCVRASADEPEADLFGPVRLDYLVLGHQVPHVHCHVLPQYENDDPLAPIDVGGTVRLTRTQQAERVALLHDRLLNGDG
jgi:hypothetical protein